LNLLGLVLLATAILTHHHISRADAILPVGNNSVIVDAAGSVEWRQKERVFIASEKAVVRRGDVLLNADKITASYRNGPDGKMEIVEVKAAGNVFIQNKDSTARGNRGELDVEKQVLIIYGPKALFSNQEVSISANEELRYFLDNERAIANGKVTVTTTSEIIEADQVEYDLNNQRATAVGEVRVTRGNDVLLGGNATIDFKTGISRISGTTPKNSKAPGTVRGVIFPQSTR
jgi:lipopolysaccharide export system protein LptA